MKTLELQLKKDVLIIDENDFDYYEIFKDGIYFKLKNSDRDYIEGNYKLISKGSDLTEEIASELVETHKNCRRYIDYTIKEKNRFFDLSIPSFISAIESKGFFWLENPISLKRVRIYKSVGDTFKSNGIKKVWQEAEEKTFRNPLIFVKK